MGNYVSKKINKSDSDNNLENINYLLNISIEEKEKENEQLKEELENVNNDNVRNVEALRKTVMLLENELNELKSEKATFVNLNDVLEKKEVKEEIKEDEVKQEEEVKEKEEEKEEKEEEKEEKEEEKEEKEEEKEEKEEEKEEKEEVKEEKEDNNIPLIHQPDVLEELEI